MYIIFRWALNALALYFTASVVPGIHLTGAYAAFITVLVLGLVNALIRPILIILTLPINILTLGLFTFVINGLLFWLVSTWIKGFTVDGFIAAFLGALVFSIISWIISQLLKG